MAEPDPELAVCKCGHKYYYHYPLGKKCQSFAGTGTDFVGFCTCTKFRPLEGKTYGADVVRQSS